MKVQGKNMTSAWLKPGNNRVMQVIDQRYLPFKLVIEDLSTVDQVNQAICEMRIRGAPLIGVVGAFGMFLAICSLRAERNLSAFRTKLGVLANSITATRPTAVNLAWAVQLVARAVEVEAAVEDREARALEVVEQIIAAETAACHQIGMHGLNIIKEISRKKSGQVVNILTHCNAGWLCALDYGTATAPIYLAHDSGIAVHVWVSETRPRNQGAKLTAWEFSQHGVPNTILVDNAAGHLMQLGKVDLVIVGSDRTSANGDVANKIGTYLKALVAKDNQVPFYVALPSSTIDWEIKDGVSEIPIEERAADEVNSMSGRFDGDLVEVQITDPEFKVVNFGFDVTPARLVTGLITEQGVCAASAAGLRQLFGKK